MDKLIQTILTTKRSHNSKGELEFLGKLHEYIKALGFTPKPMAEGCLVVEAGASPAMFSCHIDTVHSTIESDGSKQGLFFDESFQHIFLADKTSTCLGADDGAGIYIMLKMLEAKVPGTYVFHRGEERGGIGARAMVKAHKEWAERFSMCVAFDRPHNDEVIITQGGTPCASPVFGKALADALNKANTNFKYEISHKGVFTDSKVYNHLIPECVNLGVGYAQQHGNSEYLDWAHLVDLTAACIALDWKSLPIVRVPPPESILPFNYGSDPNKNPFKSLKDMAKSNSKKTPPPPPAMASSEELVGMNYEELMTEIGDSSIVEAIVYYRVQLAAERGKVSELAELLGVNLDLL
jgi:hypothetical protein